jgi:hypothetical protein
MKANIYYLDLEDKMILSIHHNSIHNNLNNTPILYFTTRKKKLFFKNVLVFSSIFLNEADKEGVEYCNLREDTEYPKKYFLSN